MSSFLKSGCKQITSLLTGGVSKTVANVVPEHSNELVAKFSWFWSPVKWLYPSALIYSGQPFDNHMESFYNLMILFCQLFQILWLPYREMWGQ